MRIPIPTTTFFRIPLPSFCRPGIVFLLVSLDKAINDFNLLHETSFIYLNPGVIGLPRRVAVHWSNKEKHCPLLLHSDCATSESPLLLSLLLPVFLNSLCVQSTMKPKRVVAGPPFPVLVSPSPWFELCAVGREGHSYQNLYLLQVHIRVEVVDIQPARGEMFGGI